MLGIAAGEADDGVVVVGPGGQLSDQPGLADALGADDRDEGAGAPRGGLPAVEQSSQVRIASDERAARARTVASSWTASGTPPVVARTWSTSAVVQVSA